MSHYRFIGPIAVLAFALAAPVITGQSPSTAPPLAIGPFDSLHFRPIGPASMSGRISDLAVYEANPAIFYVGTAHGGVWKTTNNGTTFEAQFQDQGLMSIGDVAVSQSNPDLVWVGTGESNNRQSTSWGDGVYKSTDGGKTYAQHGPHDLALHQPHRHRPAQQRRRVRRGDRQPVRARRRARRLQDDRRRQDLEAGAEGRRRHRRQRSGDGRDEQPDPLRVDVPAAPHGVLHERRRAGQRHLEVDRRRRDLDAAEGAAFPTGRSAASASTSIASGRTSSTRSIEGPAPPPARRGGAARRRGRRRREAAPAAARRPAAAAARRDRRQRRRRPASIAPTTPARRGGR